MKSFSFLKDLRTSPICNLDKVSVLIYSDWSHPKLINEKYKMLSLISKLVIVANRCKFSLGDYQVWTIIFTVKIILLAVWVSGDKNSIFFLRETVQIFVGVSLCLYINQGKRFGLDFFLIYSTKKEIKINEISVFAIHG